MKFAQKRAALIIAGAALMTLYGCGGGDDASTPAGPLVGNSTGVLTDAAVEGVAYTTTSGVTGTTNALGQYTYNDNVGERVTFKLGALTLGEVPAASIVTPLELAEGNADKLVNLLVLLQSLDDDGTVSAGIKITPTVAAAVSTGVDLAQLPAVFSSNANTSLTAALAARSTNPNRAITSTSQATTHFLEQSKGLLSSDVWVGLFDAGEYVVVQRFGPAGEFLSAEIGAPEGAGTSGLEFGTALATSVDGRGFKLTPVLPIDTNGTFGLSTVSACERVTVADGQLNYVGDPAVCAGDSTATLTKAENDPNGIVGVWALGSATVIGTQTFVFWANGKYAMLDPVGDTDLDSCGGPGVEYGTYSYNAVSKQFNVLSVSVDTNGCAGLNDGTLGGTGMASFSFTLSSDGKTSTAVFGDSTDQIFRVSR